MSKYVKWVRESHDVRMRRVLNDTNIHRCFSFRPMGLSAVKCRQILLDPQEFVYKYIFVHINVYKITVNMPSLLELTYHPLPTVPLGPWLRPPGYMNALLQSLYHSVPLLSGEPRTKRWWQLKYVLFSPLFISGRWTQFDGYIFFRWVGSTTN